MVRVAASHEVQTWEYEEIAQSLLAGHGYGYWLHGAWYRTFGSPPFAYLCAFLYLIFGHHRGIVLVVQWVFSAVMTVGVFLIGRRLFSAPAGIVAAGLVAFHPGVLYYDTHNLHPLSFDASLAVWGVVLLFRMEAAESGMGALSSGLLHGLAVLERSTFVGLPVAALASLGMVHPATRRRAVALYLLGVVVVYAPWIGRSLLIYGNFTINSTDAETLWRGNNPRSDGGVFDRDRPGLPIFTTAPEEFRQRVLAADEIGQRQLFAAAAQDFILADPGTAFRLFLRKLWGFWWFMPQSGILYPIGSSRAYTAYYVMVALLALVGFAIVLRAPSRRVGALTIGAFMLSVSLVHAIFLVELRHRWGVEPLLLVFAAGGACGLGDRWVHAARGRHREGRPLRREA